MKASSLATLIRLAKADAEAVQVALAALAQRLAALEAQDAALARALQAEAAGGDAQAFALYAQRVRRERAALLKARAPIAAQEAALRDRLSEAFLELKKLEKLQADRVARDARAEAALDAAAMDELAQRRAGG